MAASECLWLICVILIVSYFRFIELDESDNVYPLHSDTGTNRKCADTDFRCNDGPCIDRKSVCNGLRDCPKEDDENNCDATDKLVRGSKNCYIPWQRPELAFKIRCPSKTKLCFSHVTEEIVKFSELTIECKPGYEAGPEFNPLSNCLENGTWYPNIVSCRKRCTKTPTYLDFKCKLDIKSPYVPCPPVFYAGIVVTPQCISGYEFVNTSTYRDRFVTCLRDGSWDRDFPECKPICGKLDNSVIHLISHGTPTNYTPWNIALYRKDRGLICGGTLLKSNVVLSAAHCVYSPNEKQAYNASLFFAMVGKYTSNSSIFDYEYTQKSEVERIFLPKSYSGGPLFEADLAILWLTEKFFTSVYVQPACVRWEDTPSFVPLHRENKFGNITGFGLTEHDKPSNVSLRTTLPFISLTDCYRWFKDKHRPAIDKFCAGTENGSSVQSGDSGGGLLFEDRYDNIYYLRGVVSNRLSNLKLSIAVFTDITHHIKWILNVTSTIEFQQIKTVEDIEIPQNIQNSPPLPPLPQGPAKNPGTVEVGRPQADETKTTLQTNTTLIKLPGSSGPGNSACTGDHFRCGDGTCIRRQMMCDGAKNCVDGSDESVKDCIKMTSCTEGNQTFRCDYGACTSFKNTCNGRKDCVDGSDEKFGMCNDRSRPPCKKSQFRCNYGACIVDWYICDGKYDCIDGSDENSTICANKSCGADEFRCHYGGCVKKWKTCNGRNDCVDGSDETLEVCNVARCTPAFSKFECDSGTCIDKKKMCNGQNDCEDGSDETYHLCRDTSCSKEKFKCDTRDCIWRKYLCDGQKDCISGDDEDEKMCKTLNKCSPQEFACDSVSCIDSGLVCDGKTDCSNGKDETKESCKNLTSRYSAEVHFKCAYGAYIQRDKTCDGIRDCADGSDETELECSTKRCSESQFRCAYGACINIHDNLVCNGKRDCIDSSDEDPKICNNITCLPNEFKCKNGICIDSALRLNKFFDCNDGSDETSLTYTPFAAYAPVWPPPPSCIGYNNRTGTQLVYQCPTGNQNCFYSIHQRYTPMTKLFIACEPGYQLPQGITKYFTVCHPNSYWTFWVEYCLKICNRLPTNLDYGCLKPGTNTSVACNATIYSGTVVIPRCKPFHHPESNYRDRYVTCLADGTWDRDFFTCSQDCGKFDEKATNLAPWGALVQRNEAGQKPIVCGATLLTNDVVITAAQCVHSTKNVILDGSSLSVFINQPKQTAAKGNAESTSTFKIRKLFLPRNPKYSGHPNYHAALAILWLQTKVQFNANTLPPCVQWKDDQLFIPSRLDNKVGKLTGSSLNKNGAASGSLRTVSMLYLDSNECRRRFGDTVHKNLADDKTCAVYEGGVLTNFEENGAGLVFQDRYDKIYYLRAVSSFKVTKANSTVIAFTDIGPYTRWIREVIDETEKAGRSSH